MSMWFLRWRYTELEEISYPSLWRISEICLSVMRLGSVIGMDIALSIASLSSSFSCGRIEHMLQVLPVFIGTALANLSVIDIHHLHIRNVVKHLNTESVIYAVMK
jgi:hypothetical protein